MYTRKKRKGKRKKEKHEEDTKNKTEMAHIATRHSPRRACAGSKDSSWGAGGGNYHVFACCALVLVHCSKKTNTDGNDASLRLTTLPVVPHPSGHFMWACAQVVAISERYALDAVVAAVQRRPLAYGGRLASLATLKYSCTEYD